MKTQKLFLVPLCFLLLSACGPKSADTSPSSGGGDTSDTSPSSQDPEKLNAPALSLNTDKNGLTWAAVEGAVSYSISVNEGEATSVTTPGYAFEEVAGLYAVSVVAVASDTSLNSDPAQYSYTTAYTALGALTSANGMITWASYVGVGLEYSFNGGDAVAVQGNSIAVEQAGLYTVKALPGFVDADSKYIINKADSVRERTILAQPAAAATINLELGDEDSNTDLQGKYTVHKYTSQWEASTATATLDRNNEGLSDSRCVRLNVYCNGTWFRWRDDTFQATGAVNYLSFYAKATAPAAAKLYFRFEITQDTTISGLNFKNVFLTYQLDNVPSGWKSYVVDMTDENWKLTYNNTKYSLEGINDLLAPTGMALSSFGDLFPYFGSFQMLAQCASTGSGPKGYVYTDEVKLGVGEFVPEVKDYTVYEYGWSSDLVANGLFRYIPDGDSIIRFKQGANTMTLPVAVEQEGTQVTISCEQQGADFVAVCNVTNEGKGLALASVTGTAAAYIQGMTADRATVLFDFENFTGSGVGYDGSHKDETAWTGLRSKWYSDFYSGNSTNPSAVGGNGWSMMGSSDYLDLSTQYAHTGAKSMRLKYNSGNQLRFITWDCTQAPSPRLPKGSYMSMWVRACAGRDNALKVRAVRNEQVSSSNHGSDSTYTTLETTVVADANNGWVEVRIELNPDYNYYGLAILPMKNSGSVPGSSDPTFADKQYFYVDDICIYNTISPF